MANEQRLRLNLQGGTINPVAALTTTSTVIASDQFAQLPAVSNTQHLALVLNPSNAAAPGTNAEIVYITAHTSAATSATVVRGAQGSAAYGFNSGTVWVHGPTVADHSPNVVDTAASLPATNGLPFSGQMAYILDTDKWQGYDGTTWHDVLETGAWTTWNPGVGGITVGNATVTALYRKVGRHYWLKITMTMGSSSGFTASSYYFNGFAAAAANGVYNLGVADYYDASAALHYSGFAQLAGTQINLYSNAVFAAPGNTFSPAVTYNVPFTWAAGDVLTVNVDYESTS